MELRLAVRQYLDRHGVSAYRLAQATRGKRAERTVYALARGESKRVDLDTLSAVITDLADLTGDPVTPNDVFELTETRTVEPENPADLEAFAATDAAERLAALDEDPGTLRAWAELARAARPVRYEPGRGFIDAT